MSQSIRGRIRIRCFDCIYQTLGAEEAWQCVDDTCWFLSSFPEGLQTEACLRLSRPLIAAFDKSMQNRTFRISCLKAMARASREPSLASSLVGSIRNLANTLASESRNDIKVETGLLLAAILKSAANDRIIQEAVANSGSIYSLFELLRKSADEKSEERKYLQDCLKALAFLTESGGNPIRKALSKELDQVIRQLKQIIEDLDEDSWDDSSNKEFSFVILSKLASLDDNRQAFFVVFPCCLQAIEKRKCLKPALELLGWLGTVENQEEEYEEDKREKDEEYIESSLLEIAADQKLSCSVRATALQTLEFVIRSASNTPLKFEKDILNDKSLLKPALYLLERYARTERLDFSQLIGHFTTILRTDESVANTELVCACLLEVCRKNAQFRKLLRSTDGLIKAIKKDSVYNRYQAQKLLTVLGEEFSIDKPLVKRESSNITPSTETKRTSEEAQLKKPNVTPPPPPPTPKTAFPTFTSTPSAQDRSSLELAMRLQQLEVNSAPANTYPRPPTSPPPPTFSSSPSLSPYPSLGAASGKWNCSACTFENENSSAMCAVCSTPRGNSGGNGMTVVTCGGCGTKLSTPNGATSISCPKCSHVTTTGSQVKVRCQSCMTELFAPTSSVKFKCSNCGTIGTVRDRKV